MSKIMNNLLKNYCDKNSGIFRNYGYQRSNGGGYVNAVLIEPETPPKGIVLFAHATGNDCIFPQISMFQEFINAGYSVFSFDLDGHGSESTTSLTPDQVRTCIGQAIEIIDSLGTDLPIHLIGQSLGGALVLDFLSKNSHKISSAAIMGVPIYITKSQWAFAQEILSLKSSALKDEIKIYGAWNLIPAFGKFKRSQFPVRLKGAKKTDAALKYVDEVVSTFERIDVAECVKLIETPVLLCYGDTDQIAPVEHGEILFDNLKNCELVTVYGETHFTLGLASETKEKITNWLEQH